MCRKKFFLLRDVYIRCYLQVINKQNDLKNQKITIIIMEDTHNDRDGYHEWKSYGG